MKKILALPRLFYTLFSRTATHVYEKFFLPWGHLVYGSLFSTVIAFCAKYDTIEAKTA